MQVLFDVNIVLDHLMERQPFYQEARYLFSATETGSIIAWLSAGSLPTIHYLSMRVLDQQKADQILRDFTTLFHIARVDEAVAYRALESPIGDFEDALLVEAGKATGLDAIVTRDKDMKKETTIRIFEPAELCAILQQR